MSTSEPRSTKVARFIAEATFALFFCLIFGTILGLWFKYFWAGFIFASAVK